MRSKRFWLITALMALSFLVGSWLAPRVKVEWEPGKLPNQASAASPKNPVIGPDEPVAHATSIASPSVVNIDTVKRFTREDFLFGPQTVRQQGSGSGVVIDSKGYVLTNDHVVAGADEITVTFGNGTKCRGKVLGTDQETDVGLVRLLNPPASLSVAHLGDSNSLAPGQWAIAIGNPYGYQQTVTLGVVSHTGRAVQVEDRLYKELIQTDAAINPGNSGGALVDIHGNIIGINTVVRQDAQGIGFAIPINLARRIADELIKNGKIKRPWSGLNTADVTRQWADYLGLDRLDGALVEQLDRRGPAFRAGIRPGDVIRELKGTRIRSRADSDAIIARAKIGDKLPFVVERQGQLLKGEIVIDEKP